MTANRLAMSKALGAAFLNHQVEQLERKVTSGTARGRGSGWREERRPNPSRPGHGTNEHSTDRSTTQRRGGAPGGGARTQKRLVNDPDLGHGRGTEEKTQLNWRDDGRGHAERMPISLSSMQAYWSMESHISRNGVAMAGGRS